MLYITNCIRLIKSVTKKVGKFQQLALQVNLSLPEMEILIEDNKKIFLDNYRFPLTLGFLTFSLYCIDIPALLRL